jgi:hypothetical protein
MTYISRDPFAREELHRVPILDMRLPEQQGCDWCGNKRKNGKLFVYSIHTDGGSTHKIEGRFCCVDCMEAYHS